MARSPIRHQSGDGRDRKGRSGSQEDEGGAQQDQGLSRRWSARSISTITARTSSTPIVYVAQDGKWVYWPDSEYAAGKKKLAGLPARGKLRLAASADYDLPSNGTLRWMSVILAQQLFNGLMLGVIYAMIAVGFSLFFGVLDVIKFSHGDVVAVGAFSSLGAAGLDGIGRGRCRAVAARGPRNSRGRDHRRAGRGDHRPRSGAAAAPCTRCQRAAGHLDGRHRTARSHPARRAQRRQSKAVSGVAAGPARSKPVRSASASTA